MFLLLKFETHVSSRMVTGDSFSRDSPKRSPSRMDHPHSCGRTQRMNTRWRRISRWVHLGSCVSRRFEAGQSGWTHQQHGEWTMLSHQADFEWRGTGIAVDMYAWAIVRRLWIAKGTWFKLKHVVSHNWVGSIYLSPYLTTEEKGLPALALTSSMCTRSKCLCRAVSLALRPEAPYLKTKVANGP